MESTVKIDLNKPLLPNVRSAGVLIAALTLGACASIIHGTHQDVGISSDPTGASVTVDGHLEGKTPYVASLRRKDNHVVRIELPGYKPFETTVTRSVSGWVWGNIVFGGLIGLGVDAISGGLYKLTPEQVSGSLASTMTSRVLRDDGVYVAVVLEPESGWQRIGQLERD
jgi:hypothetical protein